MRRGIYYQDNPLKSFEEDQIGFEEEVNMLKEGLDGEAKIIGLISDYGSGKSSVIDILEKKCCSLKYEFIRINLIKETMNNDDIELHKNMILQLASNRYKKNKFLYYINRINPNRRLLHISSSSFFSKALIVLGLILIVLSFLVNNDKLNGIINISSISNLIGGKEIVEELFKLSGIIGIAIIIATILLCKFVVSFIDRDGSNENGTINEADLISVFNELLPCGKTTVIVIEDLERASQDINIERFIKSIISFYCNSKKVKFIVSTTPDKYKKFCSIDNANVEEFDENYKPFDLMVKLSPICDNDYRIILKQLLFSKEKEFRKILGINIKRTHDSWYILTKSNSKMNIRILKNRINDVIHLYMTLKSRFPDKDKKINIDTCIAFTYLKNEYGEVFENFTKENDDSKIPLKELINSRTIVSTSDEEKNMCNDILKLIDDKYIDYNCDMYIYNYSKHNKILDVYESSIYNAYIYDKPYELAEEIIERTVKSNEMFLVNAIKEKKKYSKVISDNVFESNTVLNLVLKSLSSEERKEFYLQKLALDSNNIDKTSERLKSIEYSSFYTRDHVDEYIRTAVDSIPENNFQEIIKSRLLLIDIFNNYDIELDYLYSDNYPLITNEEIRKYGSLNRILTKINYKMVNINNIAEITGSINSLEDIVSFSDVEKYLSLIDKNLLDYSFKHLFGIKVLPSDEKQVLFDKYGANLNIDDYNSIVEILSNCGFVSEKIESSVIDLLEKKAIGMDKYKEFINLLPHISEKTLDRLVKDDCFFEIPTYIVDMFREKKKMYEYIKYSSISNNKITLVNNKKYVNIYERIYQDNRFDELIPNSEEYLSYINKKKIYEKYDISRFFFMSYLEQNMSLLEYAFKYLDINQLNNYLSNISRIVASKEELSVLIDSNKHVIVRLEKNAIDNFKEKTGYKSIKSKVTRLQNNSKS